MRVLVTGGGGFVGSYLVESQLQQGHHVRAIDVHTKALAATAAQPRLEIIPGDITDAHLVAQAVDGIDVVYHLASAHLGVEIPPAEYWRVNVYATLNLLSLANAAGVKRFVHCSSNSVVGEIHQPPIDESAPCYPTNIYETTKLAGEQVAIRFGRETGFAVVVARPSWVYGPRCPRTRRLFRMVHKGRFVMFGDGSTLRHPIHISDAVRGLELCAQSEDGAGQVYFLAGEQAVTLNKLVHEIANVSGSKVRIIHLPVLLGKAAGQTLQWAFKPLGKQPPFSMRSMDFYLKPNAYATGKAQRELGFEPQVDLHSGMLATYRSLYSTQNGN